MKDITEEQIEAFHYEGELNLIEYFALGFMLSSDRTEEELKAIRNNPFCEYHKIQNPILMPSVIHC